MPIFSRSLRMSVSGELTSSPSTRMLPESRRSSALMHRSRVLLPEPLRPMMATVSRGATASETPFNTSTAPKPLYAFSISTSDMQSGLQPAAERGERVTQREVDRADAEIREKRPERRGVQHLCRARELDEADHRCERGGLDDLDQETDGRRSRQAQRLRHDHVAQLLQKSQAQRSRGFPLRLGNRVDAAAPYLTEECRRFERQRNRRGEPRVDVDAQQSEAEVHHQQLAQQRGSLEKP